jgi:multidrug efflux pump subunit AcrA (membrane-fusion protein)
VSDGPRRRLGRTLVTALILALVGGGTAMAWVVASGARSPGQRAAQAEPPPPPTITAKVDGGELVDQFTLPGKFVRSVSIPVRGPDTPATGSKAVVTRLPLAAGAEVRAGTVLAEVSGRPLIALPGEFPAYRDLSTGDKGVDVKQLQQALRTRYHTPVTGELDERTGADLRKLYASVGYEPLKPEAPAGTSPPENAVKLPMAEIVYVPTLPATVGAVSAKVGQGASAELLTLDSGDWQVVAELAEGFEQQLRALPPTAAIRFGDGPAQGRPAHLGTIRPIAAAASPSPAANPSGTPPASTAAPAPGAGKPVNEAVFLLDGDVPATPGQAQVVVVERSRSPAGAVIVPASAVHTLTDQSTVVVVREGAGQRRVPVTVRLSIDGRIAVTPQDGQTLPVGADVLVGSIS